MKKLTPDELLPRAKTLASHAVAELASGDAALLQNAAGKAWAAARMSALAVVFRVRRERPRGAKTLKQLINAVARDEGRRDVRLKDFAISFGEAFDQLHIDCSENGECDAKQTPREVRSVATELLPLAERVWSGR